jgi:Cu+-exporting ATPase
VLRPGDQVPTDGEVVEGNSAVDESMLTGESVPVDKAKGNSVYAGTVNVNGRLAVEVTATGEGTALAHIIAAVQRAQNSRANIQRLADRVSNVFVPAVVLVALMAALWWGLAPASAQAVHAWLGRFIWTASLPAGPLATAFMVAAAVLIIACPCAMGLATPAAIMAGSNAAARLGILIKDGVALEKAGNVTAVVFDKTGTLTYGQPVVVQVWSYQGGTLAASDQSSQAGQGSLRPSNPGEAALLQLAAALAQHSSHPISQAVARISEPGADLPDWQEIHGAGTQARITPALKGLEQLPGFTRDWNEGGTMVRLGSLRWLRESGVDLGLGQTFIEEWSGQGATLVGLGAGKALLGVFAIKDRIKEGAHAVIQDLRRQGLRIYLVTGDNPLTAAAIAKQVGIDAANVLAEIRPERKAEFVSRLQQQGERVAFVGDGINDAPALEQADLGVAVSRASDIAREAADIILLKSEIEAVPESLGLARATLRTIKQNLFWAFFYNAVGIPLAALGFMSPILCAAAMGFSDIVVIGNALRLRRWRLKKG